MSMTYITRDIHFSSLRPYFYENFIVYNFRKYFRRIKKIRNYLYFVYFSRETIFDYFKKYEVISRSI